MCKCVKGLCKCICHMCNTSNQLQPRLDVVFGVCMQVCDQVWVCVGLVCVYLCVTVSLGMAFEF